MDEQEKATEQEAVRELKEDEVRAKVVEEFGFDEIDDAERIDKLVKKEMDSHKKLSTAIGQKIKLRNERDELKNSPPPPPAPANAETVDIDKKLEEKLQERDLESLEYPDDIKKDIGDWAKFKGISVKTAARDPLFTSRIKAWEDEQKTEEATISRTNRSSSSKKFDFDNPPALDTSSPEAFRKSEAKLEEWKAEARKQGY